MDIDAELMLRFKQGDVSSFEKLMRKYKEQVGPGYRGLFEGIQIGKSLSSRGKVLHLSLQDHS